MDEITPNEIARTLGVTGLTFRNWLRAQKAAGNPIVATHEYRARYQFTPDEARQLILAFRSSNSAAPARRRARAASPRRRTDAGVTPPPSRTPALPSTFSRSALTRTGFVGWSTWSALRRSGHHLAPSEPGVYLVYRPSGGPPSFVHPSPAGRFKQKDPTVPEIRLQREWIPDALVVYIGKADDLRRRLSDFSRFGAGEAVGHWGGRLIWQLADADDLLVAWHAVDWSEAARDYERRLLTAFASHYNSRRPFANLTG